MTKITFYGELETFFGREISLFLDSLKEIGSALECQYKGFQKYFKNNQNYSVFVDGKLLDSKDLMESMLENKPSEIVFVPVIVGSGTIIGGWVAGWVLGAAAAGTTAYAVVQAAVALVLYAAISAVVTSIFAPKPKAAGAIGTANAGISSYFFNGRLNKAQQGQPVPIVYGELIVGSYVIQAGLKNFNKEEFAALDAT